MGPEEWKKIQSAPDGILTDVEHYHPEFIHDESRLVGRMDSISFPRTEDEVTDHVARMCRAGTPVTVQGVRTGISGGAVPQGGHVLNLGRMNTILGLRYDEARETFFLVLQAGVYLRDQIWPATTKKEFDTSGWPDESRAALERFRSEGPYYFPPDPSEPTVAIGGMAGCNSSGARSFHYGPTRAWIERARVVLADGSVLELKRGRERASGRSFRVETDTGRVIEGELPAYEMPKVKNSAGYFVKKDMDLLDLFIGSEGTLGFFSELEVRLIPAPAAMTGMMIFFPSEEGALDLARELKAAETRPGRSGPRLRRASSRLYPPVAGVRTTRPVAIEFFDRHSVEFMLEIKGDLEKSQMGHEVPAGDFTALYVEYHGGDPALVEEAVDATLSGAARHGVDKDLVWIEGGHEAIGNFKQIKHLFPERLNGRVAKQQEKDPRIQKLGTDLAVPEAEFGNLMELYRRGLDEGGFDHMTFGHLGDNNLHVNIIARDFEEYERGRALYLQWARAAVRMGGTVSAEHGIGKTKKAMLKELYSEDEINQMIELKRCFDPDCLLNRGDVFDHEPRRA